MVARMDMGVVNGVVVTWIFGSAVACMKPNPLLDQLAEADESSETAAEEDDAGEATPDLPVSETSCGPSEVFAPACGTCLAGSCCEVVSACAEVEGCACLAECLIGGGNAGLCMTACDGAKVEATPELEQVLACADEQCAPSC